jgi:hypothetical protein
VVSEHDDVIPHPGIENYLAAFKGAHSLTYRVIEGADHALSEENWQQAYTSLLLNWATEMVLGAREEGAASGVHTHLRQHRAGNRQRQPKLQAFCPKGTGRLFRDCRRPNHPPQIR